MGRRLTRHTPQKKTPEWPMSSRKEARITVTAEMQAGTTLSSSALLGWLGFWLKDGGAEQCWKSVHSPDAPDLALAAGTHHQMTCPSGEGRVARGQPACDTLWPQSKRTGDSMQLPVRVGSHHNDQLGQGASQGRPTGRELWRQYPGRRQMARTTAHQGTAGLTHVCTHTDKLKRKQE